jgi:AcrR family transcriptional regulator
MARKVDWDERRAELAEAVWRTIAHRGIAHTSIRNIAEESGWSRGVLQMYFRDKEELMLFAFELACDHAMEVNYRAQGETTGLEATRRRLLAYACPDEEQRLVFEVLIAFMARAKNHPDLAEAQRRRYGDWARSAREVFQRMDAQGELRKGLDLGPAAVEYLAFSMGLAELQVIESDLLAGIVAERTIDGYLSRIGSPAELKRLGIAP